MKNNTEETALVNNYSNVDRSRDYLSSSTTDKSDETKKDASPRPSSSKKVSFEGASKHNSVNVDTGGLRRSPRIAAKQKKQLDPSLNHTAIVNTNKVSEEDVDPKEDNLANNNDESSNSNDPSTLIEHSIRNN